MSKDEILQKIRESIQQRNTMSSRRDLEEALMNIPIPGKRRDLLKEEQKMTELIRLAWLDSIERRRFQVRLFEIESKLDKLDKLDKRWSFVRAVVIIFLAALTLATEVLFGFGILHPKSAAPPTPTASVPQVVRLRISQPPKVESDPRRDHLSD